ncbi:ABC transporter ATP-binding protein [Streptomyces sp. NBC_00063]|uniref:ABC transporter ATP-binding protein n=1 Tax=Streptomyces sp. NBC_00063 TaxID=2975638 RepID=UPI003D722F30
MSGTTGGPVLEAAGVGVRFGGIRALDGAGVTLRAGEVCGLIGPNGAGKTTFFDVVSGIRRPDAGRVLLDGEDITRRSPVWRARHGMRRTFQRQQLFGQLTVADNLLVAQEWRGGGGGLAADLLAAPTRRTYERRRRERASSMLRACGLEALAGEYAGALPVGQARMVELARAGVEGARVVLLDEPASGMTDDEICHPSSVGPTGLRRAPRRAQRRLRHGPVLPHRRARPRDRAGRGHPGGGACRPGRAGRLSRFRRVSGGRGTAVNTP